MNVVVAPDSFKGGPRAAAVARAIADGWRKVRPGDAVVEVPLADGGEGTIEALHVARLDGELRTVERVTGPDGRPTDAEYLLLPDGTAVVELARSSGLPLMGRLDPLRATTRGLGEVLAAALDVGAVRLLVGVGGSASTDGGAGALVGMGARLTDDAGAPLSDGGAALVSLAAVDTSRLRPPPPAGVEVLTDVDSPLLGPSGAAAVFGPQKGATAADVEVLERGLAQWAALLGGRPEAPGAGAAGGTAYGLATLWGARLVSGSEAVATAAGLSSALAHADVVITGEGALDRTSFAGKVVGTVAAAAAGQGVAVCVVAGRVDGEAVEAAPPLREVVSLTELAGSAERSLREPERFLREAGRMLARSAQSSL